MIRYLFICLLSLSSTSYAKCIYDVASVGLTPNVVSYNSVRANGAEANVSSKLAANLYASWLTYCPEKLTRFELYTNLRFIEFDKPDNANYDLVDKNKTLPSFGIKMRKRLKWLNQKFELPFDLEFRREIGFRLNNNNTEFQSFDYSNLKIQFGMRYHLWRDKIQVNSNIFSTTNKRSLSLRALIGPLIPISGDDNPKLGYISGIELQYFQLLGKKVSIRVSPYLEYYKQDFDSLETSRTEIGLRTKITKKF